MKRAGIQRKIGAGFSSLNPGGYLKRSTPIKSRRKRPTVAEGSKYLAACRGEECYLRVPGVCCSLGWAHDSVVDCHSNQSKHGKAGGLRALHQFTVPGCGPCHYWLDFGPAPWEEKVVVFDLALGEWVPVRALKMMQLKTAG